MNYTIFMSVSIFLGLIPFSSSA